MPLYQYRCTTCNEEFDILQKMADPELSSRPGCDKSCCLKKLPTSFTPKFSGTGFYETDYKSKQ